MIHVLLGTIGGPGSERAAAWTAELRSLLDGELEIVESCGRGSAEVSPDTAEELDARNAADLERWASLNDLDDAPRRVMRLTAQGAAEVALEEAACDWCADFVVIGSEDDEGWTSHGFGSLAHRLAHHVRCPLIVVPPGETTINGGTVVVGVDGSAASAQALHWATRLAAGIGGHVAAVFSVDAIYETFDSSGWFGPDERRAAMQAAAAGPGIEYAERFGPDPAFTLREFAAECDAVLIVVTAKEHASLGGVLLGPIADRLLHDPTRPVAVLPHGFVDSSPPSPSEV